VAVLIAFVFNFSAFRCDSLQRKIALYLYEYKHVSRLCATRCDSMQDCRNENPQSERSWGFNSPSGHQINQ
jgi:hypothetical protein